MTTRIEVIFSFTKIDLLHGYLISKKHILKLGEKNRALDPNDAYRAIHSAYDEQKDQLELAASLI